MNTYDKLYYDTHNEHQKALKEKAKKKSTKKKSKMVEIKDLYPKKKNTSSTARNAVNAKLQTAKKVMDSKY